MDRREFLKGCSGLLLSFPIFLLFRAKPNRPRRPKPRPIDPDSGSAFKFQAGGAFNPGVSDKTVIRSGWFVDGKWVYKEWRYSGTSRIS